ncbi:unnamed protein product [Adineta steineri]|uniref:DUF4590 domain-containing protein n=1 Tax=Adineta steineri TaxID=433720 RepID=A0A814UY66_9BILA|nr:unnamed protein product [Adineta steineri]CAF3647883.1 unnamed protein product [Adineta steineri]
MDYFLRRRRQRLIQDLIELQREEDIQRQYETVIDNFKDLDRYRYTSEDDEYTKKYHYRRKEYCLVTLVYRGSNTRRKHLDEIMIIQHNRTVFKGCLQNGDQLTFKSKRYRNESEIKFKFYINDLFEDEMIGCCEYSLINRHKRKQLFQIEHIIGSKPCYNCKFDYNTLSSLSSTSESVSRQNSLPKVKSSSVIHRQSSFLPNDQFSGPKLKKKPSSLFIPQTTDRKAPSEGFSADVAELSDSKARLRKKYYEREKSDEDQTDSVSTGQSSPSKRKYGPPQLSMMSVSEAPDSPILSIHEQTIEYLFDSSSSTTHSQLNPVSQSTSNFDNNQNRYTQHQESISLQTETNSDDIRPTLSLNNSNEMAIANDATQLLLTRLGILRQQQIERPEVTSDISIRERGNVEHFALIYLHSSSPAEKVIKQLRNLVNFVKIFNDTDDCVAFINSISYEKIILIISNLFSHSILPRIQELQQIFTIYILHDTNDNDIEFTSTKSKIQGFYTNINDIYEDIRNSINKISRDLMIYLSISSNAVVLDPMFVYFQLLTEIILNKNEVTYGIKELIDFSRQEYAENDEELKIINEFEKSYQKSQAIYWFSRKCFLSKMIDKALRIPDAEILYKLRIFIQDLCQQIENESIIKPLTVYLPQTIQRSDLDSLQKDMLNKDFIVFPQFLFATTDQLHAKHIAKEIPLLGDDYTPLIIRVDIPEDFKCAHMNSTDSDFDALITMNTMGRLIKIEKDNLNEDRTAIIHVTLVQCDNQQNIQQQLDIKRTDIKSFSPFATLIKLMIAMNQQISAEQIVQTMFDMNYSEQDINIQSSIAASFHMLATSRRNQDDFQRAVELYLRSLDTFLRIIPSNALELSTLYINIATMYFRLDNYEKSHEYYQKGLDIHLHSNTPDLYSVSNCTNSIGIVYLKQGLFADAIKSFERTLKILQQIPETHESEIALTYDNIGDAYLSQGKYEDALNNYTKSLTIQEQIEPRNPQTIGSSYHTVGNIYLKLGRCKEALTNLRRALEYQQQYLPLTHPAFALLYNNIGLMHYRLEEHTEALQCYSKSLEIAAIALPENHSMVGVTLFNIALIYSSQDKYDEAIESIEKSTAQFLKTLPPDHPDVLENKSYIESITRKKMLKELFDENTTSF